MKTSSIEYIEKEEGTQRQPAELYHIWTESEGEHWYYTSGDSPIIFGGNTYVISPLQRSPISYNSEIEVSTLSVSMAIVEGIIPEYFVMNPIERIWIEVSKLHRNMETLEEFKLFTGQIRNVNFSGAEASVECVGFEHFLKYEFPRYRYQSSCNHTLFDGKCGVNREDFKVTATVNVDSTHQILTSDSFSSYDNGWFTRGFIEYGNKKRLIVKHSVNTILIRTPIIDIESGDSIHAYAGCMGTPDICLQKFDNLSNFFGFPHMPFDNPITTGMPYTIQTVANRGWGFATA